MKDTLQYQLTPETRAAIFAKDVLTIEDLQHLLLMSYQAAAKLMRDIKRKNDRLQIQGKLHVQDYLDYFGIDGHGRYGLVVAQDITPNSDQVSSEHIYRSVCYSGN